MIPKLSTLGTTKFDTFFLVWWLLDSNGNWPFIYSGDLSLKMLNIWFSLSCFTRYSTGNIPTSWNSSTPTCDLGGGDSAWTWWPYFEPLVTWTETFWLVHNTKTYKRNRTDTVSRQRQVISLYIWHYFVYNNISW